MNDEWMEFGLCRETDPEIFFPEKGGSTKAAKAVCGRCEVQAECLAYALERHEPFGIWGGASERDRRRMYPTQPIPLVRRPTYEMSEAARAQRRAARAAQIAQQAQQKEAS